VTKLGDYHIGLPVGANRIIDGEENFTRTGEDGAEPIFSLKGTDKFFGEVLEGTWLKYNDGVILGPWTALITGGALELTGRAAVAGNNDFGWVQSQNRLYMLPGAVIDVHLKLPGHSAVQDFVIQFILSQLNSAAKPDDEPDYIMAGLYTDNANYKLYLFKRIGGTVTTLINGDALVNPEGTLRIKIDKDGEYTFYYHDGAGAVIEASDEVEAKADLGLNFYMAYVAYELKIKEDANRTVSSEHLTITYPDFSPKYELADADVNKGDCKIFDGDPDTTGVRVFDCDHDFSGDIYIQNGLIRLHIDEAIQYGFNILWYNGATWAKPFIRFPRPYLPTSVKTLEYNFLKKIVYYSIDKIIISVRMEDTATQDGDYYADLKVTLERGKYYLLIEIDEIYPCEDIRFQCSSTPAYRFSYAGGDLEVGDDDVGAGGVNTTMSENFAINFDDTLTGIIGLLAINEKPAGGATGMLASGAGYITIDSVAPADHKATKLYLGLIPFPDIANLFKEAEDATTTGTIVDPCALASGGKCVLLNAQNEYVRWRPDGGTDLPVGRYLVIFRAKDSNQEVNDFLISIRSEAPGGPFRNQENYYLWRTLTAAWKYYQVIFDILQVDVDNNWYIELYCRKDTVNANDINMDYFLLIPISNGQDWAQDQAHSALRGRRQLKRVFER